MHVLHINFIVKGLPGTTSNTAQSKWMVHASFAYRDILCTKQAVEFHSDHCYIRYIGFYAVPFTSSI